MGRIFTTIDSLNPLPRLSLSLPLKNILAPWLIVLLVWSPWLILAFPGDVHFDTVNQIYQYVFDAPTYYYEMDSFVDAEFLDHHPFFDTLIFGLFYSIGDMLGVSWLGIFIYTLLQVLLSSALLVFCICYLEKLHVPKLVRLVLLIYVAAFPPFPQFAATMSKDTLFTLVYTVFFLCSVELFLSKGERLKGRRFLIVFSTSIVLCLLTKKTGVFVIGITALIYFVAYRRYWKSLVVSFVIPIICCVVLVPLVLYPLVNVSPGGKQESLGPLFQQTAAYFINWPGEISQEEYDVVSQVLEPDLFKDIYRETTVDPIKATFKSDALSADINEYLIVWAAQGLRHPQTYIQATSKVNAGFFDFSTPILYYGYTFRDDHNALFADKYGESLSVEKPSELKEIDEQVKTKYYDVIKSSKVLSFLLSDALWASWVPILCMLLAFRYNRSTLKVFIPVIILILFLVITPTILSRYILPLLYTLPLMVGVAVYAYTSRDMQTRETLEVENAEGENSKVENSKFENPEAEATLSKINSLQT